MRLPHWFVLALTAAAMLATSGTLEAGPLGAFFGDVNTGYHRNKNWPEPFQSTDRALVSAPMAVMIRNGWEQENLIGSHHYKMGTTELTESGQLKIRWILTQAERGYRTIFIEQGDTPQETADRMASVRRFADRIAIGGEVADVRESDYVSRGWPADYIDDINVKFRQSTPPPRLPASSEPGSTGGSSGM